MQAALLAGQGQHRRLDKLHDSSKPGALVFHPKSPGVIYGWLAHNNVADAGLHLQAATHAMCTHMHACRHKEEKGDAARACAVCSLCSAWMRSTGTAARLGVQELVAVVKGDLQHEVHLRPRPPQVKAAPQQTVAGRAVRSSNTRCLHLGQWMPPRTRRAARSPHQSATPALRHAAHTLVARGSPAWRNTSSVPMCSHDCEHEAEQSYGAQGTRTCSVTKRKPFSGYTSSNVSARQPRSAHSHAASLVPGLLKGIFHCDTSYH